MILMTRYKNNSSNKKNTGDLGASIPCNLVSQTFAWDYSNLLTDTLVCVKVQCELSVVLLNNDPGGLFYSLRSHTPLKKE